MEKIDMSSNDNMLEVVSIIGENNFIVKNISQSKDDDFNGFFDLKNMLDSQMIENSYYGMFYIKGRTDRLKSLIDIEEDDTIRKYYTVIYYPLKDKLVAVKHLGGLL
jgi:hypothetical protein